MAHDSSLIHYAVAAATDNDLVALAVAIPTMTVDTFQTYERKCRAAGLECELLSHLMAAPQALPALRARWAHTYTTTAADAAVIFDGANPGALTNGYRQLLGGRLDAAADHIVDAILATVRSERHMKQVFHQISGSPTDGGARPLVPFPTRHVDAAALRTIEVCPAAGWARRDLNLLAAICRAADPATAAATMAAFSFSSIEDHEYETPDMEPVLDVLCGVVFDQLVPRHPQEFTALASAVARVAPWAFYPRLDDIAARFSEATGEACLLLNSELPPTRSVTTWHNTAEVFEACSSPNPPPYTDVKSAVHLEAARAYAAYLLGANPLWAPQYLDSETAMVAARQGYLTRRGAEADTAAVAMEVFSDPLLLPKLAATAENPALAVARYATGAANRQVSFTYQRLGSLADVGLLTADVVGYLDASVLHACSTELLRERAASVIGRWLLDHLRPEKLPLAAALAGEVTLAELVDLVEATTTAQR